MSKRLTILGAGESGVGAALLAKAKGFEVFVSDLKPIQASYKKELEDQGIDFEEGKHSEDKILSSEEIIKSPGIPPTVPLLVKAREKGIKISSEIDFASRYTKKKIIAITGTNGKTTTTLLTFYLFTSNGVKAGLGGNVGYSFARLVLQDDDFELYVLEVSSFQLEDVHTFAPDVAVLLNITPDHLDRYEYDMDKYAAAKFRMLDFMEGKGIFIYNADDEVIARHFNRSNLKMATEPFSGSWYDGKTLQLPSLNFPGVFGEDFEQKPPVQFTELPLRGPHNAMNQSAAILAALRAGLSIDQIKDTIGGFKNTEHRLEEVAEVDRVLFVNDSKATNVDAAKFALQSFDRPIVWIVGGQDKGNDYEALLPLVREKVKGIICLGKDNKKLMDFFQEETSFLYETQEVTDAVEKAYHLAEPEDVVLLAPACASFDLFKNYMDRGDQFKKAVFEKVVNPAEKAVKSIKKEEK